jgi:hypothetical protein
LLRGHICFIQIQMNGKKIQNENWREQREKKRLDEHKC